MKLKNIISPLFVLIINCSQAFSQNQNMENQINVIKTLGKDAIIKRANRIIEKKYPTLKINSSDFGITAWSNKKDVVVKFKRRIKYVRLGGENDFNYDFSVNVVKHLVIPFDVFGIDRFYIPTKEDLNKIEFVRKKINLPRQGFYSEICEKADYYEIHVTNEVAFGSYFIDKITGREVQGSIEGSYAQVPDLGLTGGFSNENLLIEINK